MIKQHLFCRSRFSESGHLASTVRYARSIFQSSLISDRTAEARRLSEASLGKSVATRVRHSWVSITTTHASPYSLQTFGEDPVADKDRHELTVRFPMPPSLALRLQPFHDRPDIMQGRTARQVTQRFGVVGGTEFFDKRFESVLRQKAVQCRVERMAGRFRQVRGRDEGPLPASFPGCHAPSWVCLRSSRSRWQQFSALRSGAKGLCP